MENNGKKHLYICYVSFIKKMTEIYVRKHGVRIQIVDANKQVPSKAMTIYDCSVESAFQKIKSVFELKWEEEN